jgi:precorrin-6Y C5,15-methyltransferase (decarboxylating)
VCVLASGDPMLFGVGAMLARQLPAQELRVLPAPSSLSLAAARLGWPLQDVATVSLVGRPLATLNAYLHDGARVFVLSADGHTPATLAGVLNARGFGATRMSVLEHLGGERERRIDARADQWSAGELAALNLIALECRATVGAPRLPLTCGLPDEAFRHDGQLTKRDVRAITLARLAPTPGELLWTWARAAVRSVSNGCARIPLAARSRSKRVWSDRASSNTTATRWACLGCNSSRAARLLRWMACRCRMRCSSAAG